jgi:hypothetical protein
MHAARRRWAGLGALALVVWTVHGLLFSGLEWAWPTRQTDAAPAAAVQVRLVFAVPSPAPETVTGEVGVPTPRPPAGVRVATVRARPPALALAAVPLVAPLVASTAAPAAITPDAVAMLPPVSSVVPTVATATVPAEDTVPTYHTELPPALALRYVMQRGALRGIGELTWRPAADGYELRFVGQVASLTVLTQVSTGGFDAAGLAPLRFTDQRARRGTRAANFQRAAGKITFSGPSTEFALRDGAQDRLSWMVQLGAILAAEPGLRAAGAKVVLYVVGANGDASVWAFDCTGVEPVVTGAGSVDALKFVREPREPYDTQVQVWLDPARHFLPVRATQKSGPDDTGFELRLQSAGHIP